MESVLELIKTIPASAWSALATAIVTSGIAYIGVSYTNRENMKRLAAQHEHDRQLRRDEVERERAEELYVSVRKFCGRMISEHFPYVGVMKGQFEYNKALDMTLESGEKRGYDPERIHMIADMYFPELSEHIKDIVEENGKVLNVREEFKQRYQSGVTRDEEMASLYLAKIEGLISSTRDLEKKVISVVKNV